MPSRVVVLSLFLLSLVATPLAQSGQNWIDAYRPAAAKLITESQRTDAAWQRLAELTDTYGPRLSGRRRSSARSTGRSPR